MLVNNFYFDMVPTTHRTDRSGCQSQLFAVRHLGRDLACSTT